MVMTGIGVVKFVRRAAFSRNYGNPRIVGREPKTPTRLPFRTRPIHYGPDQPRIQTKVLGHSLVLSLVFLTAHLFAYSALLASLAHSAALCCAHWFVRSLTTLARGTVNDSMAVSSVFSSILDHRAMAGACSFRGLALVQAEMSQARS